MRRIDTSVEIDAPPERVWREFADYGAWAEWNPFIPHLAVEGRDAPGSGATLDDLRPGMRLEVRIQPVGSHGMTFKPRVVEVDPGRSFTWFGRFALPRIFDGRHHFRVEPAGDGRTRFVHSEELRGLLVPVLGGMLENTEEGFEEMNRALKERVESAAGGAAASGGSGSGTTSGGG